MTRVRKPRVDSRIEQVRILSGQRREITAPPNVPLDAADLVFFNNVILEFARAEWSQHQLELAAMLARCMSDLEREQTALRSEGSVLVTEKGTPVVNPRRSCVQMHAGTIFNFRRSLSLHAITHVGDKAEVAKRRELNKALIADNPLDDSLLAVPN